MSEETLEAIEKRKNFKAKLNQCETRLQMQYSEIDREIKKGVKREIKVDR
jgi:flagellar hook-associated protein FlgK